MSSASELMAGLYSAGDMCVKPHKKNQELISPTAAKSFSHSAFGQKNHHIPVVSFVDLV